MKIFYLVCLIKRFTVVISKSTNMTETTKREKFEAELRERDAEIQRITKYYPPKITIVNKLANDASKNFTPFPREFTYVITNILGNFDVREDAVSCAEHC